MILYKTSGALPNLTRPTARQYETILALRLLFSKNAYYRLQVARSLLQSDKLNQNARHCLCYD